MKQKRVVESFIEIKSNEGMQCGNYTIELEPLKEGEQYRFFFDATACVGCHCCEVACNEQNANLDDIKWRRVGEMEAGTFPDTLTLFNSMSCNHCIEPSCLIGCPSESYIKLDNGIVWHDDESCIGCQYCTWNCPYEVPVFNPDRGIVTKCHMCADKLKLGQTPACVQACPSNAIMIEKFDPNVWQEEQMHKEGVAPHLPDPNITKPTTRYKLPEFDEDTEFKPADAHILKPSHPEWPLVFMTILTQLSLGAFGALTLGYLLGLLIPSLPSPSTALFFAAILPALIGLPLSALHLGRPVMAYKAMKNWRTSWLSREAIALGIFAFGGVLVSLLRAIGIPSVLLGALMVATLATAIYGIHAQAMIYRIKARPSWDRFATNVQFFLTSYLGFYLIALLLLWQTSTPAASVLLALVMTMALMQLLTTLYEVIELKGIKSGHPLHYPLSRSYTLLTKHFGKALKVRIVTLVLFGIIIPILVLVAIASGSDSVALALTTLGLICSFVSEMIGRYLFYVTVVPLGLAGNFFAGRQRG